MDLKVGRRIERGREDEQQATSWENATLLCFDPSVLPAEITGYRHFYTTYADLLFERVPQNEIVHEIVFLCYLNKQTELAYETIELSVEAALEEF